MSSNQASLTIQYHLAANDVDTSWLVLCNLVSQPKKDRDQLERIIELHRAKLQNIETQENAIKLSEPHWYTSKVIDHTLLVTDFILGCATLGVGIWDFKYQQDLKGNVQRTRVLLGFLITVTVITFLYSSIKGVRAYVKSDVKKRLQKQLDDRRAAMFEQKLAFNEFCEYIKTDDPKLQTEKLKGVILHLKKIPPQFSAAYRELDEFLSELISIAQKNEEAKELVAQLVEIQIKRRSHEGAPKDPKDKSRLEGSKFLKLEGADKAQAPTSRESFRMLEKRVDEFSETENHLWGRIREITGHHFKMIKAENEVLVNPLEEPPPHLAIDIKPDKPD